MKHHFTLLIFILLSVFQAKAQLQKETRLIGEFDKIKATKGVNITLIHGEKPSAEIHIRNASPGDVITTVENRTLIVKLRTKIYKNMAVQVYVTYVSLREIDAGSGASVDSEEPVESDNLKIIAGTETTLELEVDIRNSLEVELMAAKATLSGTAKYQQINANTGSKYHAFDLESVETVAKANTGALIQVNASGKLDATATAGSAIEYSTQPNSINYKENMGGKVRQVQP